MPKITVAELEKIYKLKKKGALTEEEFERKKREFLGEDEFELKKRELESDSLSCLEKIHKLKEKGILTEQEFEYEKRKFLSYGQAPEFGYVHAEQPEEKKEESLGFFDVLWRLFWFFLLIFILASLSK